MLFENFQVKKVLPSYLMAKVCPPKEIGYKSKIQLKDMGANKLASEEKMYFYVVLPWKLNSTLGFHNCIH